VVDDWWTQSVCPINESAKSGGSDASRICDLAEAFLVGRVVHFIGYVVPQLQQMISVSLAGVLLFLSETRSLRPSRGRPPDNNSGGKGQREKAVTSVML
jgi:hypothetical protein